MMHNYDIMISGTICIFLGGGLGEWGGMAMLRDALIDQILMLN